MGNKGTNSFWKRLFSPSETENNNQLTKKPKASAEEHSVLYIEVAGYTSNSAGKSKDDLHVELSQIFALFDEAGLKYQLKRIPTLGESYLAVASQHKKQEDEELALTYFALDIRKILSDLFKESSFKLAIGLCKANTLTGEIRGVRHSYDLFGENGFIQRTNNPEFSGEYPIQKDLIDKGLVIEHFMIKN